MRLLVGSYEFDSCSMSSVVVAAINLELVCRRHLNDVNAGDDGGAAVAGGDVVVAGTGTVVVVVAADGGAVVVVAADGGAAVAVVVSCDDGIVNVAVE